MTKFFAQHERRSLPTGTWPTPTFIMPNMLGINAQQVVHKYRITIFGLGMFVCFYALWEFSCTLRQGCGKVRNTDMEAGKDVAAWPPLLTWLYCAVCVVCGEDIMLVSARLPHVTQKLLWARKRGEKGKKRIRSCGLCKPFWKDFSFIK